MLIGRERELGPEQLSSGDAYAGLALADGTYGDAERADADPAQARQQTEGDSHRTAACDGRLGRSLEQARQRRPPATMPKTSPRPTARAPICGAKPAGTSCVAPRRSRSGSRRWISGSTATRRRCISPRTWNRAASAAANAAPGIRQAQWGVADHLGAQRSVAPFFAPPPMRALRASRLRMMMMDRRPDPNRQSSTLLRRSTVVILIAALAAGIWWYTRPKPVSVVLATVGRGGRGDRGQHPCRRGRILQACPPRPAAGGRIDFIGVEEGDRVRQGQVLMRLWNEDQQAQEAVSDAQRTSSEKRVAEIMHRWRPTPRATPGARWISRRAVSSPLRPPSARRQMQIRAPRPARPPGPTCYRPARGSRPTAPSSAAACCGPFDGTIAKITGKLGEYATPSPPGVATPPAIDLMMNPALM